MNLVKQYFHSRIKTIIDYSLTITCLFLLSPVILILAVAIKFSGKGPVIYSQQRVGKSGKIFNIYKFRSMHFGTEDGVPLLSDINDKRITRLGRYMRKHRFDEIPNFINVLKGEMSLVGPRPEQQYFVDKILPRAPKYILLQNVKPGITSWGQVKYGYASNVDEMIKRLDYDLYYLENRSIWFDLKVLLYTIGIIFKGDGI
jgi:lipopolysaccharide/colanic/teichoic acid biosynthesis glycosyltransferase